MFWPMIPSLRPAWADVSRAGRSRRRIAARHEQVREAQEQRDPFYVLGQPAVANLPVTEAPLHIQERVLHLCPHRSLVPLAQPPRPGEVGQLLRREGLYSSHLTTWRKAAHSGSLKALSKKRGRKPERNPLDEKVRKLERRNARLENELRKAHLIIDVQGKVAGLLGISLDDGTNS